MSSGEADRAGAPHDVSGAVIDSLLHDLAEATDAARRAGATAEALLGLARALSYQRTTSGVAQALADAVPPVAGCQRSTVLLWDPLEQKLVLQAWSSATGNPTGEPGHRTGDGRDRGHPPFTLSSADAAVVPVLSVSREAVVVDGTTTDPALRALVGRSGAPCTVLAPLSSDEELIGMVMAEYLVPPAGDLRRDTDLQARLQAMADQAVTALQSAWLLEQAGPLAWHDALTGLPNRRLLEDRAHRALERAAAADRSSAILFIDLDRFKRVNDTLGHAAGDELIRQVAQRLREVVRRQDTVARLGGDEFAVLLPGLADLPAVRELAGRMLEVLRRPYRIDGTEIRVSASIGVAVCPEHGSTYDELLSHADEAMYRSKGMGRNTCSVFAADPNPGDMGDLRLDADLCHAVERDELFVVYQPYVDLDTDEVVGLEALVRWRHPVRGVLEPGTFIRGAEELDVILAIDEFVVREVARQLRAWIDMGIAPVRVSVNVSRRNLGQPDFADAVASALGTHGVPPELIEIEITERPDADETGALHDTVAKLRDQGVRFSIDDFGTGSSSLRQVATFPVRTLKIDRSLVQIVGPSEELGMLASAIIALADYLGLQCVAEGVETSQQSRVLLQRGCTTAQGFYFSPPLPPDDLEQILRTAAAPHGRTLPPAAPGAPATPAPPTIPLPREARR